MTLVRCSVAPRVLARSPRPWACLRWRAGRLWVVIGRRAYGIGR